MHAFWRRRRRHTHAVGDERVAKRASHQEQLGGSRDNNKPLTASAPAVAGNFPPSAGDDRRTANPKRLANTGGETAALPSWYGAADVGVHSQNVLFPLFRVATRQL